MSCLVFIVAFTASCSQKEQHYTFEDFATIPKTDVHLHINSLNPVYMQMAEKNNFRVVSPNVDSHLPVSQQLDTAAALHKLWPGRFAFFGTFSVDSFGKPDFKNEVIAVIDKCMQAGASGIKIWKNIGMVLKDSTGRYVMVDDPAFDEIFRYMQSKKIRVMGHLGEPKNCWLPLNEMTDTSNLRYYKANPQYHMFLHPEAPSYDDQINSRDNLLRKFPELDFTGAHFASLEWSTDEIARRLDSFPNLTVDMSARMQHLQYQSISDYAKVRDFLLKYQDRILYGTDITVNSMEKDPDARARQIYDRWISNWIYLATDSTQQIKNLPGEVRGMNLPKEAIDKIFNTNASKFFN
ncbi:MAG TPA: amidohydrolase family protein [Bacteroidales bacterium]|nr:amidohydrolase family protein [Bacteroidales bacterium]